MSGATHTAVVRRLPLALCLAAVAAACSPLDPPPVRALIGALIKARDASSKVEIIKVVGGMGVGVPAPT